jgi:hypothetical protein
MSSKAELTDEEKTLLQEEMGELEEKREENPTNEEIVLETAENPIKENPYVTLLTETFTGNQKAQNERAQEIVESQIFTVQKADGTEATLNYKLLNRSEDLQVRNIQRKWFKAKALADKLRPSFLSPKRKNKEGEEIDNKDYVEFNIKEYVNNPLLKGKISGESTKEEVSEVIDELLDDLFIERFNIFTKAFFGLDESEVDDYKYKDLTFMLDVAYSVYSTVPY